MNNNIKFLLNKELQSGNQFERLFKDESFFSKTYLPKNVLSRDKQFKDLIIKFKKILHLAR